MPQSKYTSITISKQLVNNIKAFIIKSKGKYRNIAHFVETAIKNELNTRRET